jgi:hypothetical protein
MQAGISICLLNGIVFAVQAGCSIAQAVKHQMFTAMCGDLINYFLFYLILSSILFNRLLFGTIFSLLAIG